jgi:hypothetical protein
MKTFENFNLKFNLSIGDKVIVKYKDSKDYMTPGEIVSIVFNGAVAGDCSVLLYRNNKIAGYYYTNLLKVTEIIDERTGEVFYIDHEDLSDLLMFGLLDYDKNKGYYSFEDEWQIQNYIIC